jgi:hypothetical protein
VLLSFFSDWGTFVNQSDLTGLRSAGFYVDKTEQLAALVKGGISAHYLFLRPRRWGKSLLLDSLAHYFYGHQAVFKVPCSTLND